MKCSDSNFCSFVILKENLLSMYPYLNIGMYIYVYGSIVNIGSYMK